MATSAEATDGNNDEKEANNRATKIDPITAVQDSIDSLALSLFEALRGVRDAVAPESLEAPGARAAEEAAPPAENGPIAAAAAAAGAAASKDVADKASLLAGLGTKSFPHAFDLLEPDYDSFILTFLNDDLYAKELVATNKKLLLAAKKDAASKQGLGVPRNEKEFIDLIILAEKERDSRVANLLAKDVLDKSEAVDALVANLPGMGRTRDQQMTRIDELIRQCHEVAAELDEAYILAKTSRDKVRLALEECTCLALGVEEDRREID